jgi:uncharacterized Zn-binding protein involved in type VI secretion
MRRSYLKIGDKSSAGGSVTEGIPDTTHYGTELSFIGAQLTCPACKAVGRIVAKGPRWPWTMMGKERALGGEICVCKCSPPPVMLPSQSHMYESFEGHRLATMGYGPTGNYLADESSSEHWIRVRRLQVSARVAILFTAIIATGEVVGAKDKVKEAARQGSIIAGGMIGGSLAGLAVSFVCGPAEPACAIALVFIGSNLGGMAAEVGNDMYQEELPVFMHWMND